MPRLGVSVAAARAVAVGALAACFMNSQATGAAHPAVLASGVDTKYVEPNVRPQDDLYRHLNGKWLDTFVIPADKSTYGSFTFIDDQAQQQMRGIVEGLTDGTGNVTVTGDAAVDARKLADLYASFMDEPRLETLGIAPIKTQMAD